MISGLNLGYVPSLLGVSGTKLPSVLLYSTMVMTSSTARVIDMSLNVTAGLSVSNV